MCANPKCNVDSIVLGRCKRCGQVACTSCGYKTLRGPWHDGAFCQVEGIFHETAVESELRPGR